MNSGFWMTDWFIGAAVAVLLLTLGLLEFGGATFAGTGRKACDAGVKAASGNPPARLGGAVAPAQFTLCERPTDILSVIPGVSPSLVRVLEKVTSKDPEQRFQGGERSVAKLCAALAGSAGEAAISGGGVDISL